MEFEGRRLRTEVEVFLDGVPLDLHLELVYHSPTGFEWGYFGSGPAQLAVAMLYETLRKKGYSVYIAEKLSLALYQRFKSSLLYSIAHGPVWKEPLSTVFDWIVGQPEAEQLLFKKENYDARRFD